MSPGSLSLLLLSLLAVVVVWLDSVSVASVVVVVVVVDINGRLHSSSMSRRNPWSVNPPICSASWSVKRCKKVEMPMDKRKRERERDLEIIVGVVMLLLLLLLLMPVRSSAMVLGHAGRGAANQRVTVCQKSCRRQQRCARVHLRYYGFPITCTGANGPKRNFSVQNAKKGSDDE